MTKWIEVSDEEAEKFVPESQQEIELWDRFFCATVTHGGWGGGDAADAAARTLIRRRRLVTRMNAQSKEQAYR